MALNGTVGQVLGPFDSTDLLAEGGAISNLTPETTHPYLLHFGVQAPEGTRIKVNDNIITVGQTGIYELAGEVLIKSLTFLDGAGDDVMVDFVY